jgi:hypothetical protein
LIAFSSNCGQAANLFVTTLTPPSIASLSDIVLTFPYKSHLVQLDLANISYSKAARSGNRISLSITSRLFTIFSAVWSSTEFVPNQVS